MTHTAHTCVSVHAHMSLECALETIRPFWSHTTVTCFIISRQSSRFLTRIKSFRLLSGVSRCVKDNAGVEVEAKKVEKKSHFYMCSFHFT